MTHFLRLLDADNKAGALKEDCSLFRNGKNSDRHFEMAQQSFDSVPGKPFSYWVKDSLKTTFSTLTPFENEERAARIGLQTSDDFRFVRLWWECKPNIEKWKPHAKGGNYALFYSDIHLLVNWAENGLEIKNFVDLSTGKVLSRPQNIDFYFRPGITWTKSTSLGASFRCMPSGSIFGVSGLGILINGDSPSELLATMALMNSRPFNLLMSLSLGLAAQGRKHYEAGIINKNPFPSISKEAADRLQKLALLAWKKEYQLASSEETTHAFLMPRLLSGPATFKADDDKFTNKNELLSDIDSIALELYGLSAEDLEVASNMESNEATAETEKDSDEDAVANRSPLEELLSWAVGVAFGRFDLRLATKERALPAEPGPFEPMPAISPGMLPDRAHPFHIHNGILVDDQGHQNDVAYLVEEVLSRVNISVPDDVRHWLKKEFFAFHLKFYSKSRRKAPIYWPLSTTTESYTLWVYSPRLTSQTLYTAINDFVEPKLKQVGSDVRALRSNGAARSPEDEKQFDALQSLELELIEFRDNLLTLAPTYKPSLDDGVQISAAPLWPLFRYKPWQKILKDTWARLEKGEYDWAHLAMAYWPDRVSEKCETDKSLAIAHDLEALFNQDDGATDRCHAGVKR